jgi:hypothetical protein
MSIVYTILVSEQVSPGARGIVSETPISNPSLRTSTPYTKSTLAADITNTLRYTACGKTVAPIFVSQALTYNTIVMVMYGMESQDVNVLGKLRSQPATTITQQVRVPVGFILARPDDEGIYLDIICAAANGSELLKYFIQYASLMGFSAITLTSLPNVLAFYPKYGFEFRTSCTSPPLITLPDEIKGRDKKVKPFPKTWEEAVDDEDYANFMVRLQRRGLASNQADHKDTEVNLEDIIDKEIGFHGFKMKLCGKEHHMESPTSSEEKAADEAAVRGLLRLMSAKSRKSRLSRRKTRKSRQTK